MTHRPQDGRPVDGVLRQMPAPYRLDAPALLPSPAAPSRRLAACGPVALNDSELLLALLHTPDEPLTADHLQYAEDSLRRLGGLDGLRRCNLAQLTAELGSAQALRLQATLELATRFARRRLEQRPLLEDPILAAEYIELRYGASDQEVMGALYLDCRSRLIHDREIFRGSATHMRVDPKPILKQALLVSAEYVLLFHVHPYGNPTPSAEDMEFTRTVAKGCDLLNIRLADHIILGAENSWVSLKRRGGW